MPEISSRNAMFRFLGSQSAGATRRFGRALVFRWARLFGTRDYQKFIVVGRSRTGSYLLIDLLNGERSIIARGELVRRLNGRLPDRVLRDVYCRYPRFVRAVGFKIFYYHPLDTDPEKFWQVLERVPDLVVIHLKRRNILRTLVSRKIAEKVNVWVDRGSAREISSEEKRVSFTRDELLDGFERTRGWEEEFDRRFSSFQPLEVFYEDLLSDMEATLSSIGAELQVSIKSPTTQMRRQNPDPLSSLIVNYDELKEEFRDTPWSAFFED